MTDISKAPTVQDPSEYLADLRRSRQHGVDIHNDQNRGRSGNLLFRSIAYGTALLIAATLIYEAGSAADTELAHAPQAPSGLQK